ncbi:unnamed protein product [Adineta ricciae]|uniref:Uncharacterized protein n=1 Tax=Adineta ricciae TaxID=249248 RepID=A0A815C8D0_ADIRI|nr:unnamed protein product [Adineta ricciae]
MVLAIVTLVSYDIISSTPLSSLSIYTSEVSPPNTPIFSLLLSLSPNSRSKCYETSHHVDFQEEIELYESHSVYSRSRDTHMSAYGRRNVY